MSGTQFPFGGNPFDKASFARGPSFAAFRRKVESRVDPAMQQIDDLAPSRRIELAGGSTGQQRLAQQTPRYEAAKAAADAYGLEEVQDKGAVQSFLDFAFRPQSAITGAVTGILGMDRAEGDEGFGRVGTALTRAYKGFSGQEQYRFSEFTDTGRRVAEGEEVGLASRGWNSALGFVIDTAVDPLTYISFGGSVMGRMRGAQAVKGKSQELLKNVLAKGDTDIYRMVEEGATIHNATRSDTLAKRMNVFAKKLGQNNDEFKKISFDETFDVRQLLNRSDEVFKSTGVDVIRELSLDMTPEIAAMVYARGGAAGLRRWAIRNFGEESGEAYFRALPKDIQGGIRIRAPFVRSADGTPIAFGIEGIGAGRLGDRSSVVRKLNEMTQSGRDLVRAKFEVPLAAFSGKSGAIYYDAVIAATGRRTIGKSSSWVDFENAQYASARMRELRTTFDMEILRTHQIASRLYDQSTQQFGKRYQDSFFEYMYNSDTLKEAGKRYKSLTEAQKSAYNTAKTWRDMLDSLGREAVEVFGEAEIAFRFLNNYVPRITSAEEIAARQLGRATGPGKGGTPDWTKHRAQWPKDWIVDDTGVARVIEWRPNHDIKRLRAGDFDGVYESDPRMWMGVYLTEVRHALNDQIVLNELLERGFVTKAQRETVRKIDTAETRRRIIELMSEQDPALDPERVVPDGIKRIYDRITDPKMRAVSAADSEQARLLSRYLQDQGLEDFLDVTQVNLYVRDESAKGIVYRNVMLDADGNALGSIKRNKDGRWVAIDGDGKALKFADEKTNAVFDELREAQAWLDDQLFIAREVSYYDNYLVRKKSELEGEILSLFNNDDFAIQTLRNFDDLTPERQSALIDTWLTTLRRFGRDRPQTTVTKSGQPAFMTGPGMQPIDTEIEVVSQSFRNWLEGAEYMNIAGLKFDPDGRLTNESQILVKAKISERLADTYAPKKVMQAMQRMFEVQQNPQSVGAKIYNDIYKPLYAAQKAWMTLGRGPGFVARNIMGGSWNNFLANVGREHTLKSARVLSARKAAQKSTQEYMVKQGSRLDPANVGEFYREQVKKNLGRDYKGVELDELMEAWDLFSKQGLAGNRETARLYGEVLRSVAGRTGGGPPTPLGDVAFGPRGIGERTMPSRKSTFRVSTDTGTPSAPLTVSSGEDLAAWERWLEIAGGDNYWIRDVMAPMVEISEDYMRFSSFLKGVSEVGLEPAESGIRGFAAASWVRTTQFDYADLSSAEQTLKMFVPFYTWTRYNVPLQIRGIIHEPGKVAQAIRIHESLGNVFAEDDTLEPGYIRDRFGFTIPEGSPVFDMLPEWARPKGDVTLGLTWGEPIGDVNAIFRNPAYAARAGAGNVVTSGFLNWREVAQMLNPGINAVSEFQRALAESQQMGARNVEDAPKWAIAMGIAYEDPTEPGRYLMNRSIAESIRQLVPVVGQAERMLPWIVGGDREPGRWTTSMLSAMFGLPAATTDDWKKASEMNRRAEFVSKQLKGEYGESWNHRMEMIRRLTDEGAPIEFIQSLNLKEKDPDQIDVGRAVATWRMLRRIELLIEGGTPEDEILAALSVFVPEGSRPESLVKLLWDYVPKPSTDFQDGVRQFGLKPVSRKDLEDLGLTINDVRNMSEDEQRSLIYWVNRNRGWTGPRT